ncbi:amidohydrolase family protein [Stappia sp. F7233]|uniref:Amidohydrolase family protein n=1 Tax=Stappia albiluteola TaxID=2758565 RepID=A0A839AK98_9HYPH|nr:amidohydrolase family protein [Stappia albiluteola]MBA5779424.1 amidohydrolase family protein [Stappia albiluteola]
MLVRKLSGDTPKTVLPKGATDTQMHLYLPDYPAEAGGPPVPEGTPGPDDYRQVMEWLGIDRVVVTQGNAHQFNNDCLLACVAAMGPVARGVAVITSDTPDAEMKRLHEGGIRGARIMDLAGGAVGLDGLAGVDARAHDFGWTVAVQFDGSRILAHMPKLEAIESRYIIDHHGKFFSGTTPDSAEVDAVKRLIDRGNCWFKFAGCYESSRTGGPDYSDIAAVARKIAAYAPERIIWGTNWPHNQVRRTEDYPDDAGLLDLVLGWAPQSALQSVLVDSPARLFDFD